MDAAVKAREGVALGHQQPNRKRKLYKNGPDFSSQVHF